jgi:hypothetical protein
VVESRTRPRSPQRDPAPAQNTATCKTKPIGTFSWISEGPNNSTGISRASLKFNRGFKRVLKIQQGFQEGPRNSIGVSPRRLRALCEHLRGCGQAREERRAPVHALALARRGGDDSHGASLRRSPLRRPSHPHMPRVNQGLLLSLPFSRL